MATRHQAITWANADPDLCCHMVLLGHNELIGPTCTASGVIKSGLYVVSGEKEYHLESWVTVSGSIFIMWSKIKSPTIRTKIVTA